MATLARKGTSVDHDGRGWAVDLVTWMFGALLLIALVTLPKVNLWPYLGELVAFMGAAAIIGLLILGSSRVPAHISAATVHRSADSAYGSRAGTNGSPAGKRGSAAGTNGSAAGNPIILPFVFAATLWAVVLGIALVLLSQRASLLGSRARSLSFIVGGVVMLLAASAVRADIAKPYRTAPLLSQESATSVPQLRGILLTRTDAAWIDWVSAAGDSLGARDVPAIAINTRVNGLFNTSGALYAFNSSGYANPWLGRDWPAAFNSLRIACTTHRPADLFVLAPGTATTRARSTTGVTKSLAACGITFPGGFRVVARHRDADPARALTIWRLRQPARR